MGSENSPASRVLRKIQGDAARTAMPKKQEQCFSHNFPEYWITSGRHNSNAIQEFESTPVALPRNNAAMAKLLNLFDSLWLFISNKINADNIKPEVNKILDRLFQ